MDNNRREPHPAAVSIGKKLKEAREKKSLTIEQIQKQTKIHSSVLVALEEGRASELLTDTYVRSFLKKYVQVLGLPSVDILKEYFPPHTETAILNMPLSESPLPEETKVGPKILYFTGIAVLAIVAILFLVIIVGKMITVFTKATPAQKQASSAASTAKKKALKSTKPAQKKKVSVKTNSESKDMIPKSTPLSLVIKVKEPVLVKLTRDGVLIFDRVMSKDLVENITANESIELKIGKAQALELTLNGRPISLPAKNNIFGLVITRKGVKLK